MFHVLESFAMNYVLFALVAVGLVTTAFSRSDGDVPPPPPGVERPQYKITVTQNGKTLGSMIIELFPDVAPKHVANFDSLVSIGFYNGTAFHRVIPGFMIQGGDPNSKTKPREQWGFGDPSQKRVPAEFSKIAHRRGIISAARTADPNSATSQFFICVADAPWLDGQYSVFGRVLQGMDVADRIAEVERDQRDNPIDKVEMTIVKLSGKERIPTKK
uniref:Peptidyl-prolyl cis-trans isomerase n=1 Tax=uncultured Bacteroidota bacterium TaxID=152509 RepID=H5S8M7_9BACT|nr:cyclophilin type peptidyl-prolyl cis-trans isomerase [uncultured Bacteroidetes bacterium]